MEIGIDMPYQIYCKDHEKELSELFLKYGYTNHGECDPIILPQMLKQYPYMQIQPNIRNISGNGTQWRGAETITIEQLKNFLATGSIEDSRFKGKNLSIDLKVRVDFVKRI